MNIEDRLESIDTSLKTLVTILQSQGAITAVAGAPESAAPAVDKPKTTRKAKDETVVKQDLVAGDPEGTRYWVSEEAKTAYAQKPGDPDPADHHGKPVRRAGGHPSRDKRVVRRDPHVARAG